MPKPNTPPPTPRARGSGAYFRSTPYTPTAGRWTGFGAYRIEFMAPWTPNRRLGATTSGGFRRSATSVAALIEREASQMTEAQGR